MWFKNLQIYKFTEQPTITRLDLHNALIKNPFRPCGAHDEFSFGFVSPIDYESNILADEPGGCIAFCGKKEEKLLPSSAINEELAKRIKDIEERELRKLPAKERARMIDELIFELLPRALTKSSKTHAYIDTAGGYLVVDAASPRKAEDLLSQLRKCLGSLPVVPLAGQLRPEGVMTSWMIDDTTPAAFTIDDECELRSPEEEGAIVSCKRHDLHLPEIKNHLDNGKQVRKLALTWKDRISFTLDANMAIKRVKFLDVIQEKAADIEAFDEVEQFEADFAIMTGELKSMLADIEAAFAV